jgi:hypothetical protein
LIGHAYRSHMHVLIISIPSLSTSMSAQPQHIATKDMHIVPNLATDVVAAICTAHGGVRPGCVGGPSLW